MDNQLQFEEDTQHGRFLTFALGRESFGLEIIYIKEIVGLQPITPIPEAPQYVKGIINLRGRIIPVVDARLRFGMDHSDYTDRTCIIVVEYEGASVGLIVDGVSEVLSIEDGNIAPPPEFVSGGESSLVKAIGKVGNDVKLLLDCQKLFIGIKADHSQGIE